MVANVAKPDGVLDATVAPNTLSSAEGRIQLVESSPQRLVLYIPHCAANVWVRGSSAIARVALGGAGCVLFLSLGLPQGLGLTGWLLTGIFVAMAATGLGTLFNWVRLRLTQLYVCVEPGRFVIQQVLLGRKRIRETALGTQSKAELISDGRQRSTICVNGIASKDVFGSGLSPREKHWLIEAINQLIAPNPAPVLPVREAKGMVEEVPPALDRDELRSVPNIVVEEASNERLRFRRPIHRGSWEQYAFLVTQFLAFAFIETTLGLGNGIGGGWRWTAFRIGAPLFEAVLLAGMVFALFGKLIVELTADWLVVSWKLGPIRFRRKMATQAVSRIVVRYPTKSPSFSGSSASSPARTPWLSTCLAVSCERSLLLSPPGDVSTARRVGGILRQELARMGRPTDDV